MHVRVCVGLLRAQIQGLCALRFDTNLDIMALSTEVVKKRGGKLLQQAASTLSGSGGGGSLSGAGLAAAQTLVEGQLAVRRS